MGEGLIERGRDVDGELGAPDPRAVATFHELARLAITEAGGAPVAFDRPDAFDDMAQAFVRLSPSFGKPFDTLTAPAAVLEVR